jgi:hypothetical protein
VVTIGGVGCRVAAERHQREGLGVSAQLQSPHRLMAEPG